MRRSDHRTPGAEMHIPELMFHALGGVVTERALKRNVLGSGGLESRSGVRPERDSMGRAMMAASTLAKVGGSLHGMKILKVEPQGLGPGPGPSPRTMGISRVD